MGLEAFAAPVVGALASSLFSSVLAPKKDAPAPAAAPAAPQASKAPTVGAFSDTNVKGAATGGPASTSLTGPGGVDPTLLKLGKNTLLGA